MAITILEKMLEEAYQHAKGRKLLRAARTHADSLGYHLVRVSKQDIETLLVHNYVAIRMSGLVKAEQERLGGDRPGGRAKRAEAIASVAEESKDIRVQNLRKEAKKLAAFIFKNFIATYNSSSKVDEKHLQAKMKGGEIEILQNRNYADGVKQVIMELLESNKAEGLFKSLMGNKKQKRSFTRRTQFIHTARTVGLAMAEKLGSMDTTGNAGRQAAVKVIQNILNDVEFKVVRKEKKLGQRQIEIEGRIGPSTINAPGQESSDWKILRPKIEQALQEELDRMGVDFAQGESSQPFDEKVAQYLANEEILKPAKKRKNIRAELFNPENLRGTEKGKVGKQKKKRVSRAGKVKVKGAKAIPIPRKNARTSRKSAASLPMDMIVLLNNQLPNVVRKNMGPPRLENKTGRFAASPKVMDVTKTAQGFPSIGYTYEKDPYQTFEVGNKQGSPDRDPRTLIDKSIREIAVQFAIGRFFTRRV